MPADPFNAFVDRTRIDGAQGGPLVGLTFAVKDLFDVAGLPTLGSTPDWNPTRIAANEHAWVVAQLLAAGATMVGKTVTDEVSLGIFGENKHQGQVINPRAPAYVPGGSSSGSAAAVAGGLCDFALGTDTGGSVRVPSSFCGLFGLRPTHGKISTAGMLPQAPSFDTAGFMADCPNVFIRVAGVLLGDIPSATAPSKLLIGAQAFASADPIVQGALQPALDAARTVIGVYENVVIHPNGLAVVNDHHQALQPTEAMRIFGDWLDKENPRLSWEVALGRARALAIDPALIAPADAFRVAFRARMQVLLGADAVLAIPTTPFPAPLQGQRRSVMWDLRSRLGRLTTIAGQTGLPQVSLPLGLAEGRPVGLSLIAPAGREDLLLHLVQKLGHLALPGRKQNVA
ncbi:MAG: amidase [Acetobacteraceae bacterium]|nr:amidase [Acetobacteraceae bacterium]